MSLTKKFVSVIPFYNYLKGSIYSKLKLEGIKKTLTFSIFLILSLSYPVAYAYDSVEEFESRSAGGSSLATSFAYMADLKNCFTDSHPMYFWEVSDMNNTYIPPVLGRDTVGSLNNNATGTWSLLSSVGRGAVYIAMASSFPFGTLAALLAIGIEYIIMISVCTNAYVVMPHEYVNRRNGWMQCEHQADGTVKNTHPQALTATEVPFYYSCDPTWDASTQTNIDPSGPDADLVGRLWGYMGAASPYCIGDGGDYYGWTDMKKYIGGVRIEYLDGFSRFMGQACDRCGTDCGRSDDGASGRFLKAGEDAYLHAVHFYAYYRFDKGAGKIQICVAAPWTLIPIRAGCGYFAPPGEKAEIDPFLEVYTSGTRCSYLMTGRKDLWSVGKALPDTDQIGHGGRPVKNFLQSDYHVTSTVVGCIKDLLIKIFLSPSYSIYVSKGFLIAVQDRMRQIVLAVLVLYVSLLGIKIMSSPQVPDRGQFLMFIIKFALVVYFTTANAWYHMQDGEAEGLFPTLIWAPDEIAEFFLDAQNDNDPIGFCRYRYYGAELLGQRKIDPGMLGGGAIATAGSTKVKMTVWDLVDCKVINYLNLGSCQYSLGGIIAAWIIGAALMVGGVGFLVGVVSFIYCFMLLLIIFKFTHIFILSAFVVSILVLVSPIFLCFALFEATKGMFQSWMKMILGYSLFPAMLFGFVALMLVTFDSVFYGDLQYHPGSGVSLVQACENIDSIFCTTVEATEKDPCQANSGYIGSKITETLDLGPLGKFTRLKNEYARKYLDVVLKLMLFALLFYFFIGAVTNLFSVLLGVQDFGSIAKGSINAIDITKAIGSKVGGLAASGGAKGAGKIGGAIKRATQAAKGD